MPRRGAGRPAARGPSITPEPVGEVRRGQLVTTYGVGAMIAADERSFVVAAIDRWRVGPKPDLQEFRLQRRLGVEGFRRPPVPEDELRSEVGVHVRLFPTWYTCPGPDSGRSDACEHNLAEYRRFQASAKKNVCSACDGPLTPSRFVVACENGHLDDFPYWDWVHRGRGDGARCTGSTGMSFHSSGRTSALRSIVIGCSCGATASMEGSFGRGALRDIGYRCRGGRPWAGPDASVQECDGAPRTLQRGSSSAWFSVTSSALSIPPFTERLHAEIAEHEAVWAGLSDEAIAHIAGNLGLFDRYTAAEVVAAVRQRETYAQDDADADIAVALRQEEYRQLLHPTCTDDFECERASSEHPIDGIEPAMLVTRLREVRALQGFTRVDPPSGSTDPRVVPVSGDVRPPWLPGVEVIGEGVFLCLDPERLAEWEQAGGTDSPPDRAAAVRAARERVLRERGLDHADIEPQVTARLILVHTLAHLVIGEWSLEAGYPAASLRERLYVSDEMAGFLVYTATSDSAGSLGGLVEQGRPEALRRSLESAVRRAAWCSADPLCMESEASGADGLNLAACHSCLLLPETSCEHNNTLLDRAMVVGTDSTPTSGYFAGLVDG